MEFAYQSAVTRSRQCQSPHSPLAKFYERNTLVHSISSHGTAIAHRRYNEPLTPTSSSPSPSLRKPTDKYGRHFPRDSSTNFSILSIGTYAKLQHADQCGMPMHVNDLGLETYHSSKLQNESNGWNTGSSYIEKRSKAFFLRESNGSRVCDALPDEGRKQQAAHLF